MLANIKKYFPCLLPLLLIFSRSLADITIVLISISFLYYSHKSFGWEWLKEKWFCFAVIFSAYCLTINSAMSINPTESLAYSLFFIRWPIFAGALAYWILNDTIKLKKFLISMTVIIIFIIFDTWWQFIFGNDIFGFKTYIPDRLTGPFKGNPHVGAWVAKLIVLPPLFLILYDKIKIQKKHNYFTNLFFIISTILFLSVFITGERMALLLTFSYIVILFIGLLLSRLLSLKKTCILLALSFFLIIIFSYLFPETTQRAIFSTVDKIINWRTSDYGAIWKGAYDVWMQNPIFGTGLHMYKEGCDLAYPGSFTSNLADGNCGLHPHNITLQLLSETGLIGFILFYLMVLSLAFSSLKIYFIRKLWLSFALMFGIIFTCFLPIASSTSFFSNKYGAIIWLLVGVMLATNKLFLKKNSF
ncbi:O-antigen ligase family protein [Methylophilaceae bacterium]|nr:O-antigen ligase family protein [Methylophilaceae bacterium]